MVKNEIWGGGREVFGGSDEMQGQISVSRLQPRTVNTLE